MARVIPVVEVGQFLNDTPHSEIKEEQSSIPYLITKRTWNQESLAVECDDLGFQSICQYVKLALYSHDGY